MTPMKDGRQKRAPHRARRLQFLAAAAALLATVAIAPPARASHSPGARLPDLAVLSPTDIRIVNWASGRRVLRFTSVVVNIGRGPLQLSGVARDGYAHHGDILAVKQQILEADGTFAGHNTPATMFWSGDGHNHWHVTDIQVSRLKSLENEHVGSYAKVGFCFLDSYRYGSLQPARYTPANSVCQTKSNGRVPMGISVRWGDIYPSSIALQWIDITGLPNGVYRLKVIADPADIPGGAFVESDETNNRGWAKIRITAQHVTVLARSARP
jgi:hypothetical protein